MGAPTEGSSQVTATASSTKVTYYVLGLGTTLAASLIWGINTLFLLDAGLTNLEAFAANAFFTAGMVLFEIPTGIVADMWGRRASFLLGTLTLAVGTVCYVLLWRWSAPLAAWAIVSLVLGLGFTFFSGAVEAWLVDALHATGYDGQLEAVLARGQAIRGAGMLVGSVGGGYLAQLTDLGGPFVVRVVVLLLMFGVALVMMRDVGFAPRRNGHAWAEIRRIAASSVEYGWRVPAVKYLMLAAPCTGGAMVYVFYALQPHLLDLYGDPQAYGVAGLVAAIIASAQIVGGLLTMRIRRLFQRRTTAILAASALGTLAVVMVGVVADFWAVLGMIVLWGLLFAASMPIRQAYLNDSIPSEQRATILSFDSLMSASGGIVTQPALGRVADVWGYPASFLLSGGLSALALPFIARARRENAPADTGAVPREAESLTNRG